MEGLSPRTKAIDVIPGSPVAAYPGRSAGNLLGLAQQCNPDAPSAPRQHRAEPDTAGQSAVHTPQHRIDGTPKSYGRRSMSTAGAQPATGLARAGDRVGIARAVEPSNGIGAADQLPTALASERTLGASSNAITCDHRLRHRDRESSDIGSHAQRDAVRVAG
jgi:hypothetical protein